MSRRSALLPPYLAHNPAWQQLIESIDEVLEDEIDVPTDLLSRLRDNWIVMGSVADNIDAREILDSSNAFYATERETLIRQANMLGFLFKQTDLLSDDDYRRVVRNIGQYWYGKGTPKFIDFLAFCLNTTLYLEKLWSRPGPTYEQYGPMVPEGDPEIGVINTEGGAWFETSHVNLVADPAKFPSTKEAVGKLIALFNALANYDLVLDSIVFESIQWIHTPGDDIAVCVKAYPMFDLSTTIYTKDLNIPSVDFGQVFSYGDGQATNYNIGTVEADDLFGINAFKFASTNGDLSADGYFTLDDSGVLRLTALGARRPTSPESAYFTNSTIKRFTPKYFLVNGPRSMSFGLITDGNDLRVEFVARMEYDLCGLVWESEDRKDHNLLKYQTNRDYRNTVWEFDLEVSPECPLLDEETKAITLTVEGRNAFGEDVVYFIALKNYADTPTSRSAHITLDFDTVMAGFDADLPVYLGDVDRMFIAIVTSSYSETGTGPLDAPETAWVTLNNSTVSGSNSTLAIKAGNVPAHSLGMSTSYDDHYDQSPERILENTWGLGYRGWINHYCGMSIFPEKVKRVVEETVEYNFSDTYNGSVLTSYPLTFDPPASMSGLSNVKAYMVSGAWDDHGSVTGNVATISPPYVFPEITYYSGPEVLVHTGNTPVSGVLTNHRTPLTGGSVFLRWEGSAPGSGLIVVTHDNADGYNVVNPATAAWHLDFLTRATAMGYKVNVAVSYETFSQDARQEWVQKDWNDNLGETGYTPPSYLLSPCVDEGMSWLKKAFVEFADIAAAAGQDPVYIQVGEPWWWYNPGTQLPCIYDYATRVKFNNETGLFAPDFGTITDGMDLTGTPYTQYKNFLRKELGLSVRSMRTAVQAVHPTAQVSFLPFIPTIIGKGIMEHINLPDEHYSYPNMDFCVMEAYDWIIGTETGDPEQAMTMALDTWGYPANRVQYLGGFAPEYPTSKTREEIWKGVFKNLHDNESYGIEKQHIWAYPLIMRDSITYYSATNYRTYWNNGAFWQTFPHGANDYDLEPRSFSHLVTARDTTGQWSDPTPITIEVDASNEDSVPPEVDAGQEITYVEGLLYTIDTVLGTAAATDNVDVVNWRFGATTSQLSDDGYYAIDNTGKIRLTASGVLNRTDYESADGPSAIVYTLQAQDTDGNWSDEVPVTIELLDADDTLPVVTSGQVFTFTENRSAGAALGTVLATDNSAIEAWRFAATGVGLSADGYFSITSAGLLRLTTAGAAANAINNYEASTGPWVYSVQAQDAAGNWSAPESVTLDVTDQDEVPPVVDEGQVFEYADHRLMGDTIATATGTDDVGITGWRFTATSGPVSANNLFQIAANGNISLTATGASSPANDYTSGVSYTIGVQARDAIGNWSLSEDIVLKPRLGGLGEDLGHHLGGGPLLSSDLLTHGGDTIVTEDGDNIIIED